MKIGWRVIEIHEGVTYSEVFKISPFRKVIEKLFTLGHKYQDERNDLVQGLVKLILNKSFGVQIRNDIDHFYKCKSHQWMETELNANALDYWKLPNGKYVVNSKKRRGIRRW